MRAVTAGNGLKSLLVSIGFDRLLGRMFAGRGAILMFHRIRDHDAGLMFEPNHRNMVAPALFCALLDTLAATGVAVVSLEEALDRLRAKRGGRFVSLTFDDGYADNVTDALPILQHLGFQAAFFVVTGLMGTSRTLDRYQACCDADRMMSWDQVRALRDRGHTIGGHGRTHRELVGLRETEVRDEVEQCAENVQRETGERPRLFCYPRGSENALARRIVGEAGFVAACTVRPGANPPGTELFALRRTEVSGDDTLTDFRLKLEGGFDAWHRLAQARHRGVRVTGQ